MEDLTLEQEFVARVFMHKVAVLGGTLMKEYIHNQEGIPEFLLLDMAHEYSDKIVNKSLKDGTFDALYDKAWDSVKYQIDEYTKVI